MRSTMRRLGLAAVLVLTMAAVPSARADVVLNFSDVPPGTLFVFNPYVSQGFTLTSSSGGFVFNSPSTGNGGQQDPTNNPYYAGANGLAAFSPATITLTQIGGTPFSLLSIDLARNFAGDLPPSTTFTGTLAGGGTVQQTVSVNTSSPPNAFQTFALTGFTNVTSVSWQQGGAGGVHQFTNIVLGAPTAAVPEPSTLAAAGAGLVALLACGRRRRRATA